MVINTPVSAEVHLVVGPREYVGLRAQGWIACDATARPPMRQRTRDAEKATCPACLNTMEG